LWQLNALIHLEPTSLRACFLTSMEQERFFNCNSYFIELSFFNFLWILKRGVFPLRCEFHSSGVVVLFIKSSIKLKYKVNLAAHKPPNKNYISSLVCVINVIE